jgi:ABC-2 type transport system permease protein
MKTWMFELRLVLHSRLAWGAVALLLALSALSVWSGLHAVAAQHDALARVAASDRAQLHAWAGKHAHGADAGQVAYDVPHLTTNPPSRLAFAAIGQRDLQPFALRVRLLGLHSQLYESEAINPELAMPGRFDFSFLLVYLAPLFVIALMHDLVTGEREAGRLRLLSSLPGHAASLWRRRVVLRYALLWLALLAPLAVGVAVAGAGAAALGQLALVATLYLAFWFGVAAWVAGRAGSSATSAAVLLACLVGLAMIVPTVVDAAIARTIPVSKGVELALAQRQEVHQGWDVPKPVTFAKFFRTHPQWKETAPVTGRFHWKWYYAMHQAGDEAVAAQVAQYRASLQAREDWTARAGLLLAPVNVQVLLHRLADTDLQAQLAYQERIAGFHTRLRHFFYPYFFNEQAFGKADFARMPTYTATVAQGSLPAGPLAALALLALAALVAGMHRLQKLG